MHGLRMPVGSREGRKKSKINFSFPTGVFLFPAGVFLFLAGVFLFLAGVSYFRLEFSCFWLDFSFQVRVFLFPSGNKGCLNIGSSAFLGHMTVKCRRFNRFFGLMNEFITTINMSL